MRSIYRQFGITDQVLDYATPVLERLSERFREHAGRAYWRGEPQRYDGIWL